MGGEKGRTENDKSELLAFALAEGDLAMGNLWLGRHVRRGPVGAVWSARSFMGEGQMALDQPAQ
jgi:hypothetical protein